MEFNKRIPIYLQISDLISYQIINGILKSGDPVPSVRDASSKYAEIGRASCRERV